MTSLDALDGSVHRDTTPSDSILSASTAHWSEAVHDTPPPAPAPPPADVATHVVAPGETLNGLAARYSVTVHDITGANPAVHDANLIHAGQTLAIPIGKDGGALPGLHAVQTGETLSGIASRYHSSVARLAAANDISDPDRIQVGQPIWIPAAGHAQAQTPASPQAVQKPGISAAAPHPTAASQAQAIVASAQAESDPNRAVQALNFGFAKVPQDVQATVLANSGAGRILDAAAGWANQPLTQKPANGEFPQAQTLQALGRLDHITGGLDKSLAGAIADRAAPAYKSFQTQPQNGGGPPVGPEGMTTVMNLSGRIAGTPQGDHAIQQFAATGAWNQDAVRNAIGAGADPAYAIALAGQLKASGGGQSGVVQTIVEGMQMGDQTKIANGESPQAALDVASRLRSVGLDASGAAKVATDGVQQFRDHVTDDVKRLAEHDAELAWLVQKDGAGMDPTQLNQAVAAYRNGKGTAWQNSETSLRQQVAADGGKLMQQMVALNQSPAAGAQGDAARVLKTIANDPAAGLAISTAIQSDPKLVAPGNVKNAADVFTLSKVGDIGRKFTNELAASYVRQNVLQKLQGVDLQDPASVASAKQAIQSLSNEDFAHLIGVTPGDTKKAVAALETAVGNAGSTPEEADAALSQLNDQLNKDASLAKAFNKTTVAGQLLRGVAVGFAGASLLNSSRKFEANPSDPQNGIKLLVDAAGFAQKNTELLVGLGKIDKSSPLGQFGGEWKLAGRAGAGDLLTGISAVLDGVSAVRAGFGLGEPQDTTSAVFSATTSIGGIAAVAPAFGAAAWLGPVGLGTVAVGIIGNTIYQDVKNAHQYEGASQAFLKAAGYNDAAAHALSAQDGILSGASGSAQMPFLAKYAAMKHIDPVQLQRWVNGLTPDQVSNLSKCLLQTAGDSKGDPVGFTAGPPQTEIITGGGWYPAQITLANTLGAFEANLDYDHVPHP